MIAAGIILALTYVGIAFTRLPRLNIDRPAAALSGALLMLLAGVLTFQEAVESVEFNTLALLLGMMILVAVLQRAGFFTLVATRAVALARTPARLLVVVVIATAVFSAILVNDVVVLLFTPIIIRACVMQRVNPVPYLIGEAMASNIGSTATIVGNPQNMLIGVTSGISYARFFAHLAPVALASTLILLLVLWIMYGKRLTKALPMTENPGAGDVPLEGDVSIDRRAILRSSPILVAVTIAFFLTSVGGPEVPLVALVAGAAGLVVSGVRPSVVIRDVDWVLLLFFGGLFVVIGGVKEAGLLGWFVERVDISASSGGILSIHAFSVVVSQLVSNVPLTILMVPFLETVPGDVLWISLAAGATLGGNLTLIGAVANIIVAEQAIRYGVVVSFWEFLKVGILVTALTVGASVGILLLEFQAGFLR